MDILTGGAWIWVCCALACGVAAALCASNEGCRRDVTLPSVPEIVALTIWNLVCVSFVVLVLSRRNA